MLTILPIGRVNMFRTGLLLYSSPWFRRMLIGYYAKLFGTKSPKIRKRHIIFAKSAKMDSIPYLPTMLTKCA